MSTPNDSSGAAGVPSFFSGIRRREVEFEFLCLLSLELGEAHEIGRAPIGDLRLVAISGGHFEGPRLKGRVLGGGNDLISVMNDGTYRLDVQILLRTEDDALVLFRYTGHRAMSASVLDHIGRGETVDPSEYYFRIIGGFDCAAPGYAWINRICVVGTAERRSTGPIYSLYAIQ